MEVLRKSIGLLMQKVPGCVALTISDRDGVPLIKVSTDGAPELALRPAFLATFGVATDQASKLGLSRNRMIICNYSSYQVVHLNKLPLIITLIATNNANTGLLLEIEPELEPLLEELKSIVES